MPFFTFIYPNLKAYLDPYKSLIFRPLWSQSKLKAPFRIGLGLFYSFLLIEFIIAKRRISFSITEC